MIKRKLITSHKTETLFLFRPIKSETYSLTNCVAICLHNNRLEKIENGSSSGLVYLRILILSGTNTNSLTQINSGMWVGLMSSLKILGLSGNQINRVDKRTWGGLSSLIELNLDSNRLKHIQNESFQNLYNLQVLILSENKLKIIHSGISCIWEGLHRLEKLNLSYNDRLRLLNKSFEYLSALEMLILTGSKLKVIYPEMWTGLSNLKRLDLDECRIREIQDRSFDYLGRLQEINLDDNVIKQVSGATFRPLGSLLKLYLAGNKKIIIHNDSFEALHLLQKIDLDSIKLPEIDRRLFVNNIELKVEFKGFPRLSR